MFKSKSAHGVHSPFVYNLYNSALRDFNINKYPESPEKLRNELLQNSEYIELNGFGAGSRTNRAKKVKIKNHAKNSLKSKDECQLLFRIIKYLNPSNILELGTSFGISTAYLCETNPNSLITSIEGETQIFHLAKKNLDYINLTMINDNIDNWLSIIKSQQFSCVIIDANHTYEATIRYFTLTLKILKNGGFVIFDDIYWSKGMTQAWNEIIKSEKVHVSIDLFAFGIVFIRPSQKKEHFILRTFQLLH